MPDIAFRLRFDLGAAKRGGPVGGRVRLLAVVSLLVALFSPIFTVGIGEPERARGPRDFALASPAPQPEAPAETETASAAPGVLVPAGLPSDSVAVPEPDWTPLASGRVDSLFGDAHDSSAPPPPRRT